MQTNGVWSAFLKNYVVYCTVEKAMAPHSSTLAWKISWRSLVGCSPWGHGELDTTEQLHSHFTLSSIGEGNGNPLQCSCLENPRDGGAWWAAIYGVAQSQTRLKRLSSSSSILHVVDEELMLLNCGAEEDSWESLELLGYLTSPS